MVPYIEQFQDKLLAIKIKKSVLSFIFGKISSRLPKTLEIKKLVIFLLQEWQQ